MIVADTNLVVALACRTDATPLADAVWAKDSEWATPPLWESEFRNATLGMIRAGIIGAKTAEAAFKFAVDRIEVFAVDTGTVLRLAETHNLTAYDAEFAALAEWLNVMAVSFDPDLIKSGLAVHPKDF